MKFMMENQEIKDSFIVLTEESISFLQKLFKTSPARILSKSNLRIQSYFCAGIYFLQFQNVSSSSLSRYTFSIASNFNNFL